MSHVYMHGFIIPITIHVVVLCIRYKIASSKLFYYLQQSGSNETHLILFDRIPDYVTMNITMPSIRSLTQVPLLS